MHVPSRVVELHWYGRLRAIILACNIDKRPIDVAATTLFIVLLRKPVAVPISAAKNVALLATRDVHVTRHSDRNNPASGPCIPPTPMPLPSQRNCSSVSQADTLRESLSLWCVQGGRSADTAVALATRRSSRAPALAAAVTAATRVLVCV